MAVRFVKKPLWWKPQLDLKNSEVDRPDFVECTVADNTFQTYAATMKNGKDVVCSRVTTVLKTVIGFNENFIAWCERHAKDYLEENFEAYRCYKTAEFTELVSEAFKARWKASEEAAEIGTRVHDLIEAFIHNGDFILQNEHGDNVVINLDDEDKRVARALRTFKDWWLKEGLKPVSIEEWLVCVESGYGGTLDSVCRDRNDKLVLCDWKTSKKIRPEYRLQVAAYAHLWSQAKHYAPFPHFNEEIERAYVIRFDKEDERMNIAPVFETPEEKARIQFRWMCLLTLYHFLKYENKDLKKVGC